MTPTTEARRDTYTRQLRALADLIDVDRLPAPINIDLDIRTDRLRVQVHSRDWDTWSHDGHADICGAGNTIGSLRGDIRFVLVAVGKPAPVAAS